MVTVARHQLASACLSGTYEAIRLLNESIDKIYAAACLAIMNC